LSAQVFRNMFLSYVQMAVVGTEIYPKAEDVKGYLYVDRSKYVSVYVQTITSNHTPHPSSRRQPKVRLQVNSLIKSNILRKSSAKRKTEAEPIK